MTQFTFDKPNFNAFKTRLKKARADKEIGPFQAARITRFAKRNWDDVVMMAYEELDVPEGAMTGLIDWENFDVEKFKAFLEAIADFMKLIFEFF